MRHINTIWGQTKTRLFAIMKSELVSSEEKGGVFMAQEGKYIFTYWNIPGRGESIRALMALGGLDFEENFVPLPLPCQTRKAANLFPLTMVLGEK